MNNPGNPPCVPNWHLQTTIVHLIGKSFRTDKEEELLETLIELTEQDFDLFS